VIFERTTRFERAYAKLTTAQAERVDEAIRRFARDPSHPSLRVKRMAGTEHIWEARASQDLRITFERAGDRVTFRNVGRHDATLHSP
jgi:mRNA interferase RelE/StbE